MASLEKNLSFLPAPRLNFVSGVHKIMTPVALVSRRFRNRKLLDINLSRELRILHCLHCGDLIGLYISHLPDGGLCVFHLLPQQLNHPRIPLPWVMLSVIGNWSTVRVAAVIYTCMLIRQLVNYCYWQFACTTLTHRIFHEYACETTVARPRVSVWLLGIAVCVHTTTMRILMCVCCTPPDFYSPRLLSSRVRGSKRWLCDFFC